MKSHSITVMWALVTIAGISALVASCQAARQNPEEQVKKVHNQFSEAGAKKDSATLNKLIAD
jgi:hypothetical protein